MCNVRLELPMSEHRVNVRLFGVRCSVLNVQRPASSVRHSAFGIRRSAFSVQYSTLNISTLRLSFCNPHSAYHNSISIIRCLPFSILRSNCTFSARLVSLITYGPRSRYSWIQCCFGNFSDPIDAILRKCVALRVF